MPQILLTGALAREHAAYASLQADMEYVRAVLLELVALDPGDGDPPQSPVRQALAASAVIAYERCFTSGWRKAVASRLKIPADLREIDAWLRRIRNEHLAHSDRRDDPGEASTSLLVLKAVGPRQVHGVVLVQARFAVPPRADIDAVIALAQDLGAQLDEGRKAAVERIMVRLRGERTLDELYEIAAAGKSLRVD